MIPWKDDPAAVRPMLASTGSAPLESTHLAYEPKYDGVRALATIDPPASKNGDARVRFWSRLGNEKTAQFPEVAAALRDWGRALERPVLVDGEIVALDGHGLPIGFQNLQGRIHLKSPQAPSSSIAFIAFDLLRDGEEDLRPLPLRDRRARLERLMPAPKGPGHHSTGPGLHSRHAGRVLSDPPVLRISEQVAGAQGRALQARAEAEGWEGIIAKRLDAPYKSGRRSPDWIKLKLVRRQACVIGGWTDPRGSRPFFGALLLGLYDDAGRLHYVGHSGAGFSDAELGRIWARLQALQTKTCPFSVVPRTNERPHWVKPQLVAEVKFTEWTADTKLRHPTYLGLRDDVRPETVKKEPDTLASGAPKGAPLRKTKHTMSVEADLQVRLRDRAADRPRKPAVGKAVLAKLLERLDEIEHGRGGGVVALPGGDELEVTNLSKVFWPKLKLTKGDLFRHYVRAAPYILPALADRPLVMKRYPNGIAAKPFYQHRAPDKLPAGVRVEVVGSGSERRPHLIGGSLVTLLYTAQLAAISQDPWFSRARSEAFADHIAIDLDPPEDLPFARVLDVARWVHDELEALKIPGFPKTSGAGGLHIYVPLPAETPYDAALLVAQIIATLVAGRHPKQATIERSVAARGKRVYVDYLQNIRSKTLASAYSARANDFAGVSTPLTWKEVAAGVSPKDFTIVNFEARMKEAGDLWAPLRKSRGADLEAVMRLGRLGRVERAEAAETISRRARKRAEKK